MSRNLIEEAHNVFNSIDRWIAFYEIQQQVDKIIDCWLTTGATALRQDFADHSSPSWKCCTWGVPWETRWYLDDQKDSINIGLGWREFELHLFHGGRDQQICQRALEVLKSNTFEPLRTLIGAEENRANRKEEGSIFSVPYFNPFGEEADPILRQRRIAWMAVNETAIFVEKVSGKIRQITENQTIVELIRDLNRQCMTPP